MAVGRATGSRDDSPRLPPLSLGLSSVRFIVNKLEAEYARVTAADTFESCQELVKYDPNVDEGYDDYDDSLLGQPRGQVWNRFATSLGLALSRCIPSVTFGNFGLFALTTGFLAPKMITYLVVYPFCRLVFGTLYPAYASYKAVRTKDLKEYVKWMMYWIVFALFTCTETFTDVFLSWFPFYYEVKIVLVLWLLSPATKGSSILYRKFVHPALCRREQGGGGLVQQLRKSYSLSDLTECEPREERGSDEADDVLTEPRLIRRGGKSGYSTRRSASESNSRSPMYFPEVDVDVRPRARADEPDFSHIKSSEDISSGYSSADNSASLTRTASLGAAARARGRSSRTTVTTIKRPQAAEGSQVIIEELQDDDSFEYANMPALINSPSPIFLSHTQPPFIYQYVGDQVKILQVLGNFPFSSSVYNQTDNTDHWEQKEVTSKESSLISSVDKDKVIKTDDSISKKKDVINKESDIVSDIPVENQQKDNKDDQTSANNEDIPFETAVDDVATEPVVTKEPVTFILDTDTTSLDTSINDNDSAESDDEASFGTPEDSPKSKRKSPKGKYGKGKAPPPPPKDDTEDVTLDDNNKSETDLSLKSTTSHESLTEIINKLPNNSLNESGVVKGLQVMNPIAENKKRHKSKSPARIPKGNTSGLGKLLQLPGKLAFWHKAEDKPKSDDTSTSSDDRSRRSSTIERSADDFQSCTDLNTLATDEIKVQDTNVVEAPQTEKVDDQITFKDAVLGDEDISREIIDKSDALQKLIEAKIAGHPEYKFISLHDEPSTSKSTDV
uniref:Receptor expression-enhancing protein n=1 Tax=Heliothis virescens TaxID=7102 RepID=A0A2A4IXH3_HELVI